MDSWNDAIDPDSPNPLRRAWQESIGSPTEDSRRGRAITRFAFAIPDDGALEAIRAASPRGVVEIGAGTGYWARLLHDHDVDVVAYDPSPAPCSDSTWFAGSPAWFDVRRGDHTAAGQHGDRTLLLVWPTRDEDWAADAALAYAAAGGATLAYVGEPPGGRTGDDRFHALIGEIDRCLACAYGVTSAPCLCGTTPLFARVETVELPHWTGYEDDLYLCVRDHRAEPLGPEPPSARSRRRRRRRA